MSAVAAPRTPQVPYGAQLPLVPIRALLRDSQNGLSKRHGDAGEPVPVLRLANIIDGAIDESDARDIRLTDKEVAKYVLQPGDLLCIRVNGSRNLVGRVVPFTAQGRWAYCDHFIRLRPDQTSVDSRYLAHYLNTRVARRQIELNMVSSAGQNTVSQGTMLDLSVPLPDLATQRAIVAELEKQFSRLDEAVANLKRIMANLKRYKAAVLSDAVEGELAGDRIGWAAVGLGEIATSVRNGISIKPVGETGARILRISAVRPMALDLSDVRYLAQPLDEFEAFQLAAGDVLFTRYNGSVDLVGVCAVVPELPDPTVYPDKLIRVRVPSEVLLPSFLVIAASTGEARAFLGSRIRTTAGQAGVSGADVKAMPLRVPPLQEQKRIVAEVDRRLSIVREVEAEVEANLKRAQALRRAVLARAFGSSTSDPSLESL